MPKGRRGFCTLVLARYYKRIFLFKYNTARNGVVFGMHVLLCIPRKEHLLLLLSSEGGEKE